LVVEEKGVFAYEKYVIKFSEIVNNEFKALRNGAVDFTLRNTKCPRNTDENIHLVELNTQSVHETPMKNIHLVE